MVLTHEMGQSTIIVVDFSIKEPLHSSFPVKKGQGNSLSTLVEGGSPKRARLEKGGEQDSFFADASCTLFRVKSFISIVVVGHDDVLGSHEHSREQDELRERCEALEQENHDTEKELDKLRENANDNLLCC
ncbi:unnamed protein product [Vicia faba]|uniref:Uncharacterized protein n=1 Tax=Vicia faba TaxID=3906 RepID=A0AAV0Z7A1_VICFA|nr:unnamed protein product [Vicia faba]